MKQIFKTKVYTVIGIIIEEISEHYDNFNSKQAMHLKVISDYSTPYCHQHLHGMFSSRTNDNIVVKGKKFQT